MQFMCNIEDYEGLLPPIINFEYQPTQIYMLTTTPALPPISEPTDFGKDKPTSKPK